MILVIDPESSQTVGVGKRSQRAKLFLGQGLLQFVGCFDECHGGHYSSPPEERLSRSPWSNLKFRGLGHTFASQRDGFPEGYERNVHTREIAARRSPELEGLGLRGREAFVFEFRPTSSARSCAHLTAHRG